MIDVDLPEGEEKLVVFGNLTNEDELQSIKISRTTPFKSRDPYPSESGATVYVTDRLNNRIDFEEKTDVNDGIYYAPSDFQVTPGDAFVLNVITTNDEHIVSTREGVKPISEIVNTIITPVIEDEEEPVDPELDNYYISALIDDEVGIKNFYKWKIYVNGELRNLPSELTLFDDKVSDGLVFRFDASNVLFKLGDSVSVKHGSMSEAAYKYYQLLRSQTDHDQLDDNFTKPSILNSNMVNVNNPDQLILGYFSAQDVRVVTDIEW